MVGQCLEARSCVDDTTSATRCEASSRSLRHLCRSVHSLVYTTLQDSDSASAPGSKSGQILEAMHTAAEGDAPPTGLFIANDSDIKRCHMLVHQALGRIGSPNMMVTNLDATMIPTLKMQKPGAAKGVTTSLQYDRILTDVPCTGDGTMRKNMLIWKHWTTGNAVGLHPFVIACSEALIFLSTSVHGQTTNQDSG